LRDIQVADEPGILVNHRDTKVMRRARRSQSDLVTANANASGVGSMDSRKHPHQRRLASTVLTDQPMDLT
jgi:hypothetical protein